MLYRLANIGFEAEPISTFSLNSIADMVARLGDFWNFLVTNFITKVAQMFGDFLGSYENFSFLSWTVRLRLGQILEKLGLLFISTSGHNACRSFTSNVSNIVRTCHGSSVLLCLIYIHLGSCRLESRFHDRNVLQDIRVK